MKAYRYEILTRGNSLYEGLFRGIQISKTEMPDGTYEQLMSPFNQELYAPYFHIGFRGKFWFTEKGYLHFKDAIKKLTDEISFYSPNYLQDVKIIEKDIPDNERKYYSDEYQICIM